MSKRNFSFLVIGAVAALGLACGPSPEVTVAEQLAETEEQIAALEADIEYLKTEVLAAALRPEGNEQDIASLSSVGPTPISLVLRDHEEWDRVILCWYPLNRPLACESHLVFIDHCRTVPQCDVAMDALFANREELGELEHTKFNLEVKLAKLELDQKMRERER